VVYPVLKVASVGVGNASTFGFEGEREDMRAENGAVMVVQTGRIRESDGHGSFTLLKPYA